MHWHGLIDHSNVPGRRFAEFADLCRTAEHLADLQGTELRSDIAILYSAESEWAFKLQPQTDSFSYMEQIRLMHQAFAGYGINVDIIDESADISGYKVICAPALYVVNPQTAANIRQFAENGGTVVLTARSGVKDQNNNCIMAQLPTCYSGLTGCTVSEYDPIGQHTAIIRFAGGETFTCRQWCDILKPDTAAVIARYDSDFYAGMPAITVNRFGHGKAYYIGTVGERRLYERIAVQILGDAGIAYIPDLPEDVEITVRTGTNCTARFLFNHSAEEKNFLLDGSSITLKPFEMNIQRTKC
jgi:beta-galactosidase